MSSEFRCKKCRALVGHCEGRTLVVGQLRLTGKRVQMVCPGCKGLVVWYKPPFQAPLDSSLRTANDVGNRE